MFSDIWNLSPVLFILSVVSVFGLFVGIAINENNKKKKKQIEDE